MQFMLTCCFDEEEWDNLPEAQRRKIMEDYGEFERGIVNSGHFLAAVQLEPASTAVTVRAKNGKPLATDGPFAETKEQLGGIHLVECRDLDEAISIAGRIPTLPAGGAVEVRPVIRMAAK